MIKFFNIFIIIDIIAIHNRSSIGTNFCMITWSNEKVDYPQGLASLPMGNFVVIQYFFQYFCRFLPKEFQFGTVFVIVEMSLTKIPQYFVIKKIWVFPKKIV